MRTEDHFRKCSEKGTTFAISQFLRMWVTRRTHKLFLLNLKMSKMTTFAKPLSQRHKECETGHGKEPLTQ